MGYYMNMDACAFYVAKQEADKVTDVLSEYMFEPIIDDEGNINGLDWAGEKLWEHYEMFCSIAPYVKTGSYLELTGEDGARWRWYFKNGECEEHNGETTWPSMEGYVLNTDQVDE